MLRHALNGLLREGAQHDQIDPALEIVRHIAQRFARVQALFRLIDKHRISAQSGHAKNPRAAISSLPPIAKRRSRLSARDPASKPGHDTRRSAALLREYPPDCHARE